MDPRRSRANTGAKAASKRTAADAGPRLLLALAHDRVDGHPDNVSATARLLGTHRDSVRAWRDALIEDGTLQVTDGFLQVTPAGRALFRAGSDPLPRALLRGRGRKPSPAVLCGCAVVYADAIGWRADRRGCRNDGERSVLARVSRQTVVAARQLLAARELIGVEELRRGRADLRRARLTEDRRATHGCPMGSDRAQRLADAAARGRLRPRRGAETGDSGGAETIDTPLSAPVGGVPPSGARALEAEVSRSLCRPEGSARGEGTTVAIPTADAQQRRRAAPASIREGLAALLPEIPAARAETAAMISVASDRAADALVRLAADPQTVPRLQRLAPPRATAQILAAAGVLDRAPRKLEGFAVQVASALAPVQTLTVALDVLLDGRVARGRGERFSVGGVLRTRLKSLLAGQKTAPHLLRNSRASWPIGRFLAAAAGNDTPRRDAVSSAPRTAGEHPAAAEKRAQLERFARKGEWRMVEHLLGSSAVRELGWTAATVAAWTGIAADDIAAQLRLVEVARQQRQARTA